MKLFISYVHYFVHSNVFRPYLVTLALHLVATSLRSMVRKGSVKLSSCAFPHTLHDDYTNVNVPFHLTLHYRQWLELR